MDCPNLEFFEARAFENYLPRISQRPKKIILGRPSPTDQRLFSRIFTNHKLSNKPICQSHVTEKCPSNNLEYIKQNHILSKITRPWNIGHVDLYLFWGQGLGHTLWYFPWLVEVDHMKSVKPYVCKRLHKPSVQTGEWTGLQLRCTLTGYAITWYLCTARNKLQHYATAYRNHKSAGEKLGFFRFCKFFTYLFSKYITACSEITF